RFTGSPLSGQFRSQAQPPDRLRIRNTQNYAPDFSVISETSKKRTKSRSHQLWRQRAMERAKWPRRPRSQSTGLGGKARHYWAFGGPAAATENVCIGANGGGNEPEIQRSPFFAQFVRRWLDVLPLRATSLHGLFRGDCIQVCSISPWSRHGQG